MPPAEPSIAYHGLINQRRLSTEYKRSSFLVQLQTRPEPFGIVVVEAMAAGCLVLASPVGAFPELIDHGENGFLLPGDPASPETHDRAAELIRKSPATLNWSARSGSGRSRRPSPGTRSRKCGRQHLNWLMDRKGTQNLEADWARCLECGATCPGPPRWLSLHLLWHYSRCVLAV